MKAQGSTEYLIVFAAILLVSLILIFLLSNYSGFGQESKIKQSEAYWSSMKPIAIDQVEFKYGEDQLEEFIYIEFENKGLRKIEIVNISATGRHIDLTGNGVNASEYITRNISSGEKFVGKAIIDGKYCCSSDDMSKTAKIGNIEEINGFTITYKIPGSNQEFKEVGTVPLRGICSGPDESGHLGQQQQ